MPMHPERKFRRANARKFGLKAIFYMRCAIRCSPSYHPSVAESHTEWAIREARAAWRNALAAETYPRHEEPVR